MIIDQLIASLSEAHPESCIDPAPEPRNSLSIPMVNLRSCLQTTAPQWQRNLRSVFHRMQFIGGAELSAFEREFAADMGANYAVGVGTGTAAIQLCLRAAGITRADQHVITPALTSPFTALAIRAAGATPVFADINADRLLLDIDDAAGRITRSTAAILPVHLYGQPCDLDRLNAVARDARITVVQDACQAHGARFRGRPLTHFSPLAAYSFYPTKNLGCLGDGGAIVTRSFALAKQLRMLRDGGRRNDQVSRSPAINSRLDEIQACFLRAFLPRLPEWNADRARLASLYDEALSGCNPVRRVARTSDSVNHLYVIRVPRRERLRAYLAEKGIASAVHYPVPLHLQPAFADCGPKRGALPQAERACREIVSLPLWPGMAESAVGTVAEAIRQFYAR